MAILTPRERGQIELLARLYIINKGENTQPTKYKLVGACASSTRSLRYKQIDELISKGLVTNEWNGSHPYRYALQITQLGETEVQYWAQREHERDHPT